MSPPCSLAQVLGATGPLLLDFDGPICAVFAGVPGATVAAQLRHVLTEHGTLMPQHITDEPDPMEILRYTATLGNDRLTGRVDEQLRRAERHAIESAAPTPYAREVIVAAYHAGRPLAIVSNNAAPAIHAYLNTRRLSAYIDHIIARPAGDPGAMKPNPAPVRQAVAALGAEPAACVLLGDSTSDIHAGYAAGVRTIGYANKPGKWQRLTQAGADAIAEGDHGLARLARLLHDEANLT